MRSLSVEVNYCYPKLDFLYDERQIWKRLIRETEWVCVDAEDAYMLIDTSYRFDDFYYIKDGEDIVAVVFHNGLGSDVLHLINDIYMVRLSEIVIRDSDSRKMCQFFLPNCCLKWLVENKKEIEYFAKLVGEDIKSVYCYVPEWGKRWGWYFREASFGFHKQNQHTLGDTDYCADVCSISKYSISPVHCTFLSTGLD